MAQRKTAKLTRRLLGVLLLALILYACAALASVLPGGGRGSGPPGRAGGVRSGVGGDKRSARYDIAHAGDEEVIADIAREKLGLVLPGEKVYYDVGN